MLSPYARRGGGGVVGGEEKVGEGERGVIFPFIFRDSNYFWDGSYLMFYYVWTMPSGSRSEEVVRPGTDRGKLVIRVWGVAEIDGESLRAAAKTWLLHAK